MPGRKVVMENTIYDYDITSLTVVDKDGYTDVIEKIFYTVTATHSDGRTASIQDSYKMDLGNLGYNGFNSTSNLTNTIVKRWLIRALPGTTQEKENKAELERILRNQSAPGSRTINL